MIASALERTYARHRDNSAGKVATYIPELGRANPDHFGIAITTTGGDVFETGDSGIEFTIQSISKTLVYGMAIERLGAEAVNRKIGVEPSGDAFNSIVLDEKTGRPFNAMVNAGAIAATALLASCDPPAGREEFLRVFSAAAGRPLDVDDAVYASEKATGSRNRAVAYLMQNCGMISGEVEAILDLYFWQCAILVTARDLAVIAATLANHGVNPITGTRALDAASIPPVLSVMCMCGMYDFSGEWNYRMGMPAKSGVAGGLIAVVNHQLGIGIYSPPLDARGNSVRATAVCGDLSADLGLHMFCSSNHGSNFIESLLEAPPADIRNP